LIYDLITGNKELKGKLPIEIESVSYGIKTAAPQIAFNPYLEEIYFSWAFDPNIYKYQLLSDKWETLHIEARFFNRPEAWVESDDLKKYGNYLMGNDWFTGIYFEPKSKRIHHLLHFGDFRNAHYTESSTLVEGLTIAAHEKRLLVFSINPENGDYDVIPYLNHLSRTFMFHPSYGPLIKTQLHDKYGLNEQDFIVLAPIEINQ
jgi:hypothetical protein